MLPTLGVGALNGTAYHFLKKEDKNKEPSEVNTEVKGEDEPNEEDTKGEKEDNKVTGDQNEVNNEVKDKDELKKEDTKIKKEDKKVTGDQNEVNNEVKDKDELKKEDTKGEKEDNKVTDNQNTSTLVWWYVIVIVVVLIIVTLCVYYIKSSKEEETEDNSCEKIVIDLDSGDESYINLTYKGFTDKLYYGFLEAIEKEPACVEITGKTVVIGDLHANTGAAYAVTEYCKKKLNDDYKIVFLGDFIDRGGQASNGVIYEKDRKEADKVATAKWRLKTLDMIADLKIKNPGKVIVLSGNHEAEVGNEIENTNDTIMDMIYTAFGKEVEDKGTAEESINSFFAFLPKCAVLKQQNDKGEELNTFLVHGTVPYDPNGKMDLNGIVEKMSDINNKADYSIENKLVKGMLWNDYKGPGGRGDGNYVLDEEAVESFKKANKIQRVISAHDHRKSYVYDKNVNYIKVITSPNMNDGKVSDGYILDIDEHGNITKVKVRESDNLKKCNKNNINNNINNIIINNNNN